MNAPRTWLRAAILTLLIGTVSSLGACDDDDPTQPPPDPPVIATGAAISIGTESATVSGTVDPRGSDTVVWFEYGLTEDYGSVTDELPVPATPAGARSVDATLTGLAPETTYHYRLAARNDGGTVGGGDATLLTLRANEPPDTFVTAAGPDTTGTTVRWSLFWFGTDDDGEVVRFEWRVADHGPDGALDPPDSSGVAWASTTVTDTVLTWDDGLGSRTFFIRAVDDREARDPTPASIGVEADS